MGAKVTSFECMINTVHHLQYSNEPGMSALHMAIVLASLQWALPLGPKI